MRRLLLLWLTTACGTSPPPPTGCPAGVLVITSDEHNVSKVGVLPLDGSPAQLFSDPDLGGDPALSVTTAGAPFFLARDRNTIFALDSCGRGTAPYSALAQGEKNTDPWDVDVAADGSLWIARYLAPSVLVLDKAGSPLGTIDLSSLDVDGNPNQDAVRVLQTSSGEKAFVALERLDDTQVPPRSVQPSQIAIVDTKTRALESVVTLAGRNPVGPMLEHGGSLWIAEMGNSGDDQETDAGIEVFSPETRSSKLLLSEVALGGSVTFSGIALEKSTSCGAAIVMDASAVNHTSVVSFDVSGNVVQPPAFGPTTGYDLWGLTWTSDGRLLVGDRSQPPPSSAGFAVHTFTHDASCKLTQGADLFLPMPPVAFAPAN
jgi:hypothetical protein